MMELPPLANLMPAGFEGNLSALSPDFSSEGFNFLLLNQMVNMEEGDCKGDGCQGESLFALSEETFFPRSEEKESLSYNTFNELIDQTLIHPLSVPVLPEGQQLPPLLHQFVDIPSFKSSSFHLPGLVSVDIQEKPSLFCEELGGLKNSFIPGHPEGLEKLASNPSYSLSSDQLHPPSQGLFISQNLKEESVDHSPFQSGSEKMAPDLSFLGKGASETAQQFVNRMGVRNSFIPGHPEGPEKLVSNISHSVSPDQLHPPSQGLFISQNLEEESVDHSPFQSGSEKMAPDLSFLGKGASETAQQFVNRMGGHREEPFSIFQMKGKDTGNSLVTGKMEDDGQSVLTSLNQAAVSSERGGPDPISKFELIGKPQISGFSPDSENDNHILASLKHNSSTSEPYSIQNGLGQESKVEHFMPEEVPKGQNGFFSKVESFEVYHQVGRKMVWSVQNGEERIKLTLDPPRLGNLYMEVTKEKEMVRATLWAESPLTKELLEAHRTELRRILEEDGFKLERFDVFVQQEADRFMERKEHSFFRGQREVSEFNGDRAILSTEPSDVPSIAFLSYPGARSRIDRII